jgi:Ca2+-binding RTX toxin-like protein
MADWEQIGGQYFMATITGDGNPNILDGGPEDDTLNGLGGDDELDGGAGVDTLNGGDGDDLLWVRAGDTGNGGAGDDILAVSESLPFALNGGAGYDILRFESSYDITGATLTGIEQLNLWAAPRMTATQLASFGLVMGYAEDYANARVDLTQGGAATVNLSPTLTNFFELNGSAQNDLITFNADYAGIIYFDGGAGNDTVSAGAGDDVLDGGDGNDTLNGLDGDDEIDGEGGVDTLNGGDGDDLLWVRADDTGNGGAGDDILAVRESLPFALNGGAGYDILRFESSYDITGATLTGIEQLNLWAAPRMTATQLASFGLVMGYAEDYANARVDLTQGGAATVNLSPTLTSYFELNGSAQNDLITFNAGYAGIIYFDGGAGNDTVNAGAGDDVLDGGDGDDTLNGGAGDDEIDGEAGDDTLNGGGGDDTLEGGLGSDVIRGGSGNDTLAGYRIGATDSQDNAADQLFGEAGDDVILLHAGDTGDGGEGNDRIVAAGSAVLIGGAGNDTLIGSTANDTLAGGTGVDTASYERSSADVTVDLMIAGPQATGGGGVDTLSGVENLTGGSGDDVLLGTGGANVLRGLAGDDTLNGRGGSDTASYQGANGVRVDLRIAGPQNTLGAGLDTLISIENLIGSEGDDVLIGNAGNNVIEGGAGADEIVGLGGVDTASYAGATQLVSVSLSIAGIQNTIGASTR